jgi:ATP-binding cassette subfamily C protein
MRRANWKPHPLGVVFASLRQRPRTVAQVIGWSIVDVLPAFVSGYAVARALDEGFLAGRTVAGLAWLGLLALSIVVGSFGKRQLFIRLAQVVEPLRDELVRRVVTGVLHRSTRGAGAPDTAGVGRLTQQVEIVRDTFAGMIVVAFNFTFTVVGALLGMLSLAPLVLLFVLPPLALGLAVFLATLPSMASRQREFVLTDERVAEGASTMVVGLRDVVACGAEERVGAWMGSDVDAQARATLALARLSTVRTLALAIGGWLPLLAILAGAPWLLRQGVTTGAVVGAFTYVAYGLHPALQTLVHGIGGSGLRLVVTMRRIIEMSDDADGLATPAVDAGRAPRHASLTLQGVTFGYSRHAEPVIHDLDLAIAEGDHVAIVGPSGIGKSTLAGLMTGLLEPQRGEVRLGDVDVKELGTQALAGHRVLIPQEAYVFAGTVLENITYLRPDAQHEEIDRAVDEIGLRSLVVRLGGYDAAVDPSVLSAGERQQIALARAYLSSARLVILDEATCHLDPSAEAQAERAFVRRPGTLVVIAHRVSSALRARRVLVLDGTQVMDGTHERLLLSSPLYRDLVGHWTSADAPGVDRPSVTPVA